MSKSKIYRIKEPQWKRSYTPGKGAVYATLNLFNIHYHCELITGDWCYNIGVYVTRYKKAKSEAEAKKHCEDAYYMYLMEYLEPYIRTKKVNDAN